MLLKKMTASRMDLPDVFAAVSRKSGRLLYCCRPELLVIADE
jgi:hypothetical protein